ncbi:ribosome small subunit-dependent GTPase A [Deinococcus deserti]|uniref:Small ribosomal subunit biogenesis GTPase RsgA n=1 Tax=Deinococcus deserti (strain DSM 17065 / CIP 109153 / LMG 22923 / VCD115) TaxID=546414 RepID=C1CZT1_DEIDV|nr:ribosome small subunit-dependent GTPase A [Deinococcus deserti]ACO45183.1 putative GTPase engC; putative ribosome biogenesis GTPase RsgA [Deinococcus deserti VCD115]
MTGALQDLGWSDFFAEAAEPFLQDESVQAEPGRIASVGRASYQIWTAQGLEDALLAGTLRQEAPGQQVPVIGDWVIAQRLAEAQALRIQQVLPRRTTFARAVHGGTAEQIIAANVDVVFIVTTPDQDFDLPRLGRYVAAVQVSGAEPVVLLNKSDLVQDAAWYLEQVRRLGPDLPAHQISAAQHGGLDSIQPYFTPGRTVALIGSSGVGKSTLTNRLLGQEVAATGSVRETDQQGRHTTTGRTLYRVPGGGLLIDNPGLRDIAVWDADSRSVNFEVIEELATKCRFRKCTHMTEPGCAVQRAVQKGQLDAQVLAAYHEAQGQPVRRPKKR